MRVTRQHLEHMQQQLQEALAEVRSLLGSAVIHRGLEVVPSEPGTVLVTGGLAFDRQDRRVAFPVCIRHRLLEEQLVTGPIEHGLGKVGGLRGGVGRQRHRALVGAGLLNGLPRLFPGGGPS